MGTLPIEAMFVAAIRLYDLGHIDEAVFWFVAARYRARLFRRALTSPCAGPGDAAFERCQAQGAFHILVFEHINPYAIDVPQMWIHATERACVALERVPEFPLVYRGLKFVDSEQLKQLNDEETKDYLELLRLAKRWHRR